MIQTKAELVECINTDKSRNVVNCSKPYLFAEPLLALFGVVRESYYVRKYLRTLRKLEYFTNINKGRVSKLYYTMKWKRLSNKYQIYIHPNTVGKGCISRIFMEEYNLTVSRWGIIVRFLLG